MRRNAIVSAIILAAAVCAGATVPALARDCRVADPTETPLNVRSQPNGRILSRLDNGMTVRIVDQRTLGGKRWAEVALDGETLGWVFSAYLDCKAGDETLKSAPMRPRTAPQ